MKKGSKGQGSLKVGSVELPVTTLPRGSILDSAAFLPVVTKTKPGQDLTVVRRRDLLPEAAAALVPPGTVDFGFRLLDVFAPTYGWDYPDAEAYFRFDRSRLVFTTSGGWVMGVGQGELDQELRLRVIPRTQANYLKILLGQVDTTSGHCHLDVRIDDVQYTTDVLPRSFGYVDVVLASHGAGEGEYEIEISLRREPNTGVVSVGLLQFELYRTIRTFPSEFVVP